MRHQEHAAGQPDLAAGARERCDAPAINGESEGRKQDAGPDRAPHGPPAAQVLHSALGTLYEEPCVVALKITVGLKWMLSLTLSFTSV